MHPSRRAARAPVWGPGQAAGCALLAGGSAGPTCSTRMSHCLSPPRKPPTGSEKGVGRRVSVGAVHLSATEPHWACGRLVPKARSRPCAADIWNWALCLCGARSGAEAGVGDRVTPVQGVGASAPGQGLPWGWPPRCPWVSPPSRNLQGFPGRQGPGPGTLPHSPPGSLVCPLGPPASSPALNSQGDLYLMGTRQARHYAWGARRGPGIQCLPTGRQSQPDDPTAREIPAVG